MAAYQQALTAHVGEHWSYTFRVDEPAAWAGWTAGARIRYYLAPAVQVLIDLEVDVNTAGQVTVSLPDGATSLLAPFHGEWDLYVKPTGGDPQYIAEGPVSITGRVTVPA